MNDKSNSDNELGNCLSCGLPQAKSSNDSSHATCSCNSDMQEKQGASIRICRLCNKRIIERDSASVTQWIFKLYGCKCEQNQFVDSNFAYGPTVVDEKGNICTNCGKRIRDEKEGSITQWIFQSHLCSCGIPSPPIIEEPESNIQEQSIYIDVDNSVGGQQSTFLPEKFEQLKQEEDLELWDSELDRYSPLKLLGKGAVGNVFLCYDKFLQKPVAIKMLNYITDEQIVLFQKEAKAASKLNHRYIVKVLDFGTIGSSKPYMVMAYIEGINLAEHLKQVVNLSVSDTLMFIEKLCQAIAFAHESGVLHHDIKSSNIILCNRNSADVYPVLIDLGVAQLQQKEKDEESSTEIVGSASYLAPEYISGGSYDERSEVYSIGCVLFELLTGGVPYLGDSLLETLDLHSNAEIPTLSSRRPDLEFSFEVENVLSKCLSKSVEKRYQSVAELQTHLNTIVESRTEYDTEANQIDRASVASQKHTLNRKKIFSLFAVLLIGVLGFVFNMTIKSKNRQVEQGILSKNNIGVTRLPSFPKSVSEFGVNGYFLTNKILVIPDSQTRSRIAETILNKNEVDRLELACMRLEPKTIVQIGKLKPKLLKLFRVSGLNRSNLEKLALVNSIQELDIVRSAYLDKSALIGLSSSKSIKSLIIQDCSIDNRCLSPLVDLKALTSLNLSLNPLITRTGLINLRSSTIKTLNVYRSVKLKPSEIKPIERQLGMVVRAARENSIISGKPKMFSKDKLQSEASFLKDIGHYYKKKSDFGLSVEYFEASVRHSDNAGMVEAYQRKGAIYQLNLDPENAIKSFSSAIETYENGDHNPVSENYFWISKKMRAQSFLDIGEKVRALKEINEVVKLAGRRRAGDEQMLRIKLFALIAMSKNKEALDLVKLILKEHPNSDDKHLLLKTRIDLVNKLGQSKQANKEETKLNDVEKDIVVN